MGIRGFPLYFLADDVTLASSCQDLQHVVKRFTPEREASGISTSKSGAMVLTKNDGKVLPQMKEFEFMSEGKMGCKIGSVQPLK